MILIVIPIVMLFGVAPFGFGNEPDSPACAKPAQAADALAEGCGDAGGRRAWQDVPSPAWGCGNHVGSLLMEHGSAVVLVNPQTHAFRGISLSPGAVRIVERGWNRLEGVVPAPWHVEWTSNETGHRIAVYGRQTGDNVFDITFARRIELSTVAVSSTGRLTIHVQANNIASEVTILDAQSGAARRFGIPHDARLAAYAIGVAFNANETCAAISMERAGGNGAETWLLDFDSGDVRPLPVPDVFVLGWTWYQV